MNVDFTQTWQGIQNIVNSLVGRLPYVAVALLVFLGFYFGAKWVRRLIRSISDRRKRHRNLGIVLGRLIQGAILLVGLLVALVIVLPNFKPVQVVEFLGIGTIAIGFAFRDILQNFLAGILLLLTEPFRIGDQIKFGEFEGQVEDIQTRATFIRTYDGRRIVIPNANLFTNPVMVNTAFAIRRVEYEIGIGVSDDIDQAKRLILEAIQGLEDVLTEPPPSALVVDLAASAVRIRVRWWIKPPQRWEYMESQDKVLTVIKKHLIANGIDLPFTTCTVLFHDQTDETDGDRARQREGWPAGKQDPPAPRSIASGLREIAQRLSPGQKDRSI